MIIIDIIIIIILLQDFIGVFESSSQLETQANDADDDMIIMI